MLFRRLSQIHVCGLVLFLLGLGQALLWGLPIPPDSQKAEVEVISNPKTPVPPVGKRKRLIFKEELRIGQREGDESYMFGATVFATADEDGNLYVTDWDNKRILKYDSRGKYVLTIGRKGQGPGEFQNLSVARLDKEGSIYVTDLASRRISFFSQLGKCLRQILVPAVFEDLYITANGSYVSNHTVPLKSDAGMAFKVVDGIFNDKFELVTEFNAREVVSKPPAGTDSTAMAKFLAGILSGMAFQPMPRHVLAEDGTIYCGYPEDYAIDVYSPEGRKTKTIRRAYDPIKVKDKDKEYFAATVARPFVTRPGRSSSEDEIRGILKFIEYPDNKPAYQSFSLLENGWLIVLVEFAAGEYSLFDVFDKNGLYIGQFKAAFPAESGLYFFKNGKAYAVETDEEGYKFIKRYSVNVEDY